MQLTLHFDWFTEVCWISPTIVGYLCYIRHIVQLVFCTVDCIKSVACVAPDRCVESLVLPAPDRFGSLCCTCGNGVCFTLEFFCLPFFMLDQLEWCLITLLDKFHRCWIRPASLIFDRDPVELAFSGIVSVGDCCSLSAIILILCMYRRMLLTIFYSNVYQQIFSGTCRLVGCRGQKKMF